MSFDLILFGGTGDLAWRKIMPALFQAFRHGSLPADGRIVGVARDDLSDDQYRALIKSRFDGVELAKRPSEEEFSRFAQLLGYLRMDLSNPADYASLATRLRQRTADVVVMYVATAPALFTTVCEQIAVAGLNGPQTRVVLEKPLGHDLASNRAINASVRRVLTEKQIFRIDHYLGKPSVQNLFALAWKSAVPFTTAPARCATWCKTMRCSCCAPWPWSRPSIHMPTRFAMKSSRSCVHSSPGRPKL